jgi:hypothetical protein
MVEAALEVVRARIRIAIAQRSREPTKAPYSPADIEKAEERVAQRTEASRANGVQFPLLWLKQRVGLDELALRLLWVLLAHEVCPIARNLLRELNTENCADPTTDTLRAVAFGGAIEADAHRLFSNSSPLITARLIERTDSDTNAPDHRKTWKVAGRIVALAHEDLSLDPDLHGIATVVRPNEGPLGIGGEGIEAAPETMPALVAALRNIGIGTIVVQGPRGSGRRSFVRAAAAACGNELLEVEANGTIQPLTLIQGNLGLPATHYKQLIDLVEIKVAVGVVNLGSGRPRDQIQEHVIAMSLKWNEMISNMAHGIEKFVRTVDHTTLTKAPNGLMEKVWDKALELVKKSATLVAGTPLAADIGVEAIKRIVAYGEKLEAARVTQDEDAFIQGLWDQIDELQLKGAESGGNPQVHQAVQKLDEEFLKVGKSNPEDEWKDGDQAVFGSQAEFLKGLERKSDGYAAAVPTIKDFESHCLIEFVNASHKLRNNSAWRSPFEGAQSMDGYVQVNLTLYNSGRWFLGTPDAGKLHCPKSSGVAKELTDTMGNLSMWDLNTNLVLKVTADDSARSEMPELYAHDRTNEIKMDQSKTVQGAQWMREYWDWIIRQCGTSTYDVLASVRKLEG